MYIMLVDDEYRICKGIARLIEKRWPDIRVEKYGNALDALASIRQERPDLLITDISMPEMDGLELIRLAQAEGLRHCAILTGFDEFELVQKALRLHAIDYFMKPVDIHLLFGLIQRVREIGETERQARAEALRQGLRLRLLIETDESGLLPEANAQDVFGTCACMALALTGAAGPGQETAQEMEQLFSLCERRIVLGDHQHRNGIYLLAFQEDQKQAVKDAAASLLKSGVLTGFSAAGADMSGLYSLYQRAGETMSDGVARCVSAYLRGGWDHAALRTLLEDAPSPAHRLSLLLRFHQGIGRLMDYRAAAQLISRLDGSSGRQALQEYMDALPQGKGPKAPAVLAAMDWIEQQYAEELTLTGMAEQVHMTPSYFSTVFHRETGFTLVDYVNHVRVDRAVLDMMAESKASVEAIAESVGFSNVNYFYRVFKNHTGMTPNEFRTRMLQGPGGP